MSPDPTVRKATEADSAVLARLLHDFNTEFDDPTPDVPVLTERIAEHIERGYATFFLVGDGPDGFSMVVLSPSLYTGGTGAYLQELYVAPPLRGLGLGRALLEATMADARERGADHIDLNTAESDTAARGLYESLGFTNREGRPDGPAMLYYERDL